MANPQKDVIYIDIDDEITGIIDKVRTSKHKIVALVLPKRAAVLHSVVNMRLLKRKAGEARKNLVLITTDAGVVPIAGAAGVHVAKTLQSKPAIPEVPAPDDKPVVISDNSAAADADEPKLDPTKPIGAYAGDDDDVIEVDNSDGSDGAAAAKQPAKAKKDKKFKIPNFNSFRARLFAGIGLLILLIVGWYLAFYVMPRAEVIVRTDTNVIDSELALTASQSATEVDEEGFIVPARRVEVRKTDSEQVDATGEEDKGEKATGEVTLRLQNCSVDQVTIPAGTGVSTGNITFITRTSATLVSTIKGGQCDNHNQADAQATVAVVAQRAGEQYNVAAGRSFTVSGYSSVTGTNSGAMSGGTTRMVKIVREEDLETANQRLEERNHDEAMEDLKSELEEAGFIGLEESFTTSDTTTTSSPDVGEEADRVTVTVTTTYTMVGINAEDVRKLVENDVADSIDSSQQSILDNGLDEATFQIVETRDNGDLRVTVRTSVVAGPAMDEEAIKGEIIGKKKGEAVDALESRPGIQEVEINYSPFWVYSTPNKSDKITVNFESANE